MKESEDDAIGEKIDQEEIDELFEDLASTSD